MNTEHNNKIIYYPIQTVAPFYTYYIGYSQFGQKKKKRKRKGKAGKFNFKFIVGLCIHLFPNITTSKKKKKKCISEYFLHIYIWMGGKIMDWEMIFVWQGLRIEMGKNI